MSRYRDPQLQVRDIILTTFSFITWLSIHVDIRALVVKNTHIIVVDIRKEKRFTLSCNDPYT